MKFNLGDKDNIKQWFMDATYYAVPRKNDNFKLLIILGFNLKENTNVLGAIILIKNEKKETFIKIFNYLTEYYKFYPETINVDCNIAQILAIKHIYKECNIILCFYHILKRLIIHLPQIRSKDKKIKKSVKYLFNNIKILLYIIYII